MRHVSGFLSKFSLNLSTEEGCATLLCQTLLFAIICKYYRYQAIVNYIIHRVLYAWNFLAKLLRISLLLFMIFYLLKLKVVSSLSFYCKLLEYIRSSFRRNIKVVFFPISVQVGHRLLFAVSKEKKNKKLKSPTKKLKLSSEANF